MSFRAMGCSCGAAAATRTNAGNNDDARRRKLSMSGEDMTSGPDTSDDASKDDKGLLMVLRKEQVLNLLSKKPADDNDVELTMAKRWSITTSTDVNMQNVTSYHDKTVSICGDEPSTSSSLGYACKKGLKPESPNQDSFFILQVDADYSVYGVFDGHGKKGHDVSNFVKECLPKVLLMDSKLIDDPLAALERAFKDTQGYIAKATKLMQIDAKRSGTTSSVIFYDHRSNTLHIAHVGDSRCVLGRTKKKETEEIVEEAGQQWVAHDLTEDHKPDKPEERARIEGAGGVVKYDGFRNYRVYAKDRKGPGLNMSRAMGDLIGNTHAGISAMPDVNSYTVSTSKDTTADHQESERDPDCSSPADDHVSSKPSLSSYQLQPEDKFILLCSDGVWEFVSSEEAVHIIGACGPQDCMAAANRLCSVAWDRWIKEMEGTVVDDITVVLVYLLESATKPAPGRPAREIAQIQIGKTPQATQAPLPAGLGFKLPHQQSTASN